MNKEFVPLLNYSLKIAVVFFVAMIAISSISQAEDSSWGVQDDRYTYDSEVTFVVFIYLHDYVTEETFLAASLPYVHIETTEYDGEHHQIDNVLTVGNVPANVDYYCYGIVLGMKNNVLILTDYIFPTAL